MGPLDIVLMIYAVRVNLKTNKNGDHKKASLFKEG